MTQWRQSVSVYCSWCADVTGFNHEVISCWCTKGKGKGSWASFFLFVASLQQLANGIDDEAIELHIVKDLKNCWLNGKDFWIKAHELIHAIAVKNLVSTIPQPHIHCSLGSIVFTILFIADRTLSCFLHASALRISFVQFSKTLPLCVTPFLITNHYILVNHSTILMKLCLSVSLVIRLSLTLL